MRVALDVFNLGDISLEGLIHLHGPQVVFQEHRYLIYSHFYDGEMVVDLLSRLCDTNVTAERDAEYLQTLRELADALLSLPTPWVTVIDDDHFDYVTACRKDVENLDSKALFGIFIAIAYIYERVNNGSHSETFEEFLPNYFQWILSAKNNGGFFDDTEPNLEAELNHCGFSGAQKAFIRSWINNSLRIVDA